MLKTRCRSTKSAPFTTHFLAVCLVSLLVFLVFYSGRSPPAALLSRGRLVSPCFFSGSSPWDSVSWCFSRAGRCLVLFLRASCVSSLGLHLFRCNAIPPRPPAAAGTAPASCASSCRLSLFPLSRPIPPPPHRSDFTLKGARMGRVSSVFPTDLSPFASPPRSVDRTRRVSPPAVHKYPRETVSRPHDCLSNSAGNASRPAANTAVFQATLRKASFRIAP